MKLIQKQVDNWVGQNNGYFKPLEILARLVEETGELARELNHRFGPKKKKPSEETKEISEELGDIIFTIVCLANSLRIDLDKSFRNTIDKYSSRDAHRFTKK
ncbi:MAG: MazG family protein [Candidatus Amesbacteria bacterium GW2011_GWB1_47_19]|nr:MAG: MazG family protein [Candidatus Amesbacteria bacterium GW2011_GWA1_44_24]KKU31056.1 MAG: MazG family protein [Candidatus Amesbacteria bacterium GW2011_GWC1_46_24]KKU66672.1 MAG: MazG family protein [Candidatus Amesbacteria bacterium GW2011_GWB1_47_19]OGD06127.1 MAG: nucleotide pyrophosphohydrolase [Candidatus Amesbacteria bacterium RIFOXYB1_FULL_47_13]HBC72277.1 nucleotide pyrophosphohydrolase [Candidatus Amesbacteria bacterium]